MESNKTKLIETGSRLMVASGGVRGGLVPGQMGNYGSSFHLEDEYVLEKKLTEHQRLVGHHQKV